MTTFEKIGIQGIRSYCDDRVEKIKFSSPITIIYGNNGSGKSTIIECLKVSCTGDFPPNAEKGKSFLHDPLVSNKMNIKGKIDLMIKNYNNKQIGISRSFSLFYSKDKNKKVKHTFRALDNSIIIKKDKGDDIIITNKCVDINNHIPKLMGVSKALLENVILCHHDESLWPFSESTKIKKKFDELFGDDHFSKVLDELIKCKKHINEVLKKKEYELLAIKDCYEKKKNINLEIEKNEKEIENAEICIQLDQEEIKENSIILDNLNKNSNILYKIISSLNTYFILYDKFKLDLEQYQNIKEIYEETSEELIKFQQLFRNDLSKCQDLIKKAKEEIVHLDNENEKCLKLYDESKVKESDTINQNINILNNKEKRIIDNLKNLFNFEHNFLNDINEKNVNIFLLKEYFHLNCIIENNEVITKKYLKWDNILSEKNYNFKFRIKNDSMNKMLSNSYSLDKTILLDIKNMKKKHTKKLKIIRYFLKRNFIHIHRNLLKKIIILKKNKIYKKRILKIDKKIEKLEKYKEKLNSLKKEEEIYIDNVKKLEKLNQLKSFYDTINIEEIDNYSLKKDTNYYEDQLIKYNNQLIHISKIKKTLNNVFHIITNCNLFYESYLNIQIIHNKIHDFMKEQIVFFRQTTDNYKIYNLIKEDKNLFESLENFLFYNDSLSITSEKQEEKNILNVKENETQQYDILTNINDNKKKKNGCELKPTDSNKLIKRTELKNSVYLEKNLKNEDKKEEDIKTKKKRENLSIEVKCQLKKRKIIFDFSFLSKNNLDIVRIIISKFLDKYERKIENIENQIHLLKEKIIYIYKEMDDIKNKIENYSNILSEFNLMLQKNNFKNLNDFVLFFCTLKKDMKKIKLDIYNLQKKEESLNNFLDNSERNHFCDLCKSDISEFQLNKVKLNITINKKDIHQQIEEKNTIFNNLKYKKKELFSILKYHQHYINPIDIKTISINEEVNSKKKKLADIQNNINKYSIKINKINEKYKLMKHFHNNCTDLINKEKDIICEREHIILHYLEMKNKSKALQELENNNTYEEVINILLESLEQINMEEIYLKELKEFLDNFKKYNHKKVLAFIFEMTDMFIKDNYVSYGGDLTNSELKIDNFKNKCESDNEIFSKYVLKEKINREKCKVSEDEHKEINIIEKKIGDGINKELKEELYEKYENNIKEKIKCNKYRKCIKKEATYTNEETKKHLNELLHHNLNDENKEEIINSYNFFLTLIHEKLYKLHDNASINIYEEKLDKEYIFKNFNFAHNVKVIIKINKIFKKIYDTCLLYINLEEFKRKEQINMINKMKSFINDRNEFIEEKAKKLERVINIDKNIRNLIKKMEKYILYYLKKKRRVENCLLQNSKLLKKCEMREKCIRKRIINNRNNVYHENKNYYLKMNIMDEFIDEIERINIKKKEKEKNLNEIKEKIYNNEAIKNEVNEIAKKINQKKEQILCLEKEKINIEKMYHSIVMNTNLKKSHERFLDHHKNFIHSIVELKNSFFLEDKKEEGLNEINSIIKQLEHIYESCCDIYNFLNESFDFSNYKNKLNELINVKKENLKEKIEAYTKTINSLKIKEAELKGKIGLRKEYIDKLKNDIKSKLFINIEKEYKKKIVEIHVYKNVIKDICNFYFSFDQAIIKFHSLKMQEINISIRNLWRRVYTSTDIDYIYIKSDVQTECNEKINQRRSYNYRVVMVKDNCELDMKGRCSSGQKVLSSIIIRLALAESFSIKCGILALDEPTTNLDKYNSRNLASLIANIVDLRKNNSTFQLILITHDTYFVDVLSQYGLTNCYYKIKKDEQGYSRIEKTQT
ncbi:DNA repair protein RAD50, putative [Plasmodium gallinaceum]|uniref:DNA repair protein RAD50, putative n=1 Tax=Plasmodium gallinaceum TaxID=5849 RepID=A0A1J1GMH6_PLAGA|nr:DNA repair protein RAD50, putative [Plasmodium gallinaceum]CRG93638.1 DNA repair protein RAD50, putative [Plasmodium gallinaceum]